MAAEILSRLIAFIKKSLKPLFLITISIYIFLLFYKPPFPESKDIVTEIKEGNPRQTPVSQEKSKQIIISAGEYEYRLTPLFNYELMGLIVSEYESENWLDIRHGDDPKNIKDVCVVWGENTKNGSYKKVKFSSGEFTCFFRWDKTPDKPFSGLEVSNNHLIPEDANIADIIRETKIGDQIKLKGILANYEVYKDGEKIFMRNTSTTRDDGGNGACEIVYVTDFEIIKENKMNFNEYKKPFGWASLTLGILGFLFFLIN